MRDWKECSFALVLHLCYSSLRSGNLSQARLIQGVLLFLFNNFSGCFQPGGLGHLIALCSTRVLPRSRSGSGHPTCYREPDRLLGAEQQSGRGKGQQRPQQPADGDDGCDDRPDVLPAPSGPLNRLSEQFCTPGKTTSIRSSPQDQQMSNNLIIFIRGDSGCPRREGCTPAHVIYIHCKDCLFGPIYCQLFVHQVYFYPGSPARSVSPAHSLTTAVSGALASPAIAVSPACSSPAHSSPGGSPMSRGGLMLPLGAGGGGSAGISPRSGGGQRRGSSLVPQSSGGGGVSSPSRMYQQLAQVRSWDDSVRVRDF